MNYGRLQTVILALIAIALCVIALNPWFKQYHEMSVSLYSTDLEGIEEQLGQIENAIENLRR